MPPFMNPRKPPGDPLSIDPDLAHFDTSKYVFADVTFGVKDRVSFHLFLQQIKTKLKGLLSNLMVNTAVKKGLRVFFIEILVYAL